MFSVLFQKVYILFPNRNKRPTNKTFSAIYVAFSSGFELALGKEMVRIFNNFYYYILYSLVARSVVSKLLC